MSVLIEAMIEAMDEYYSLNLAEEVTRGMLEKLARGKCVGSAPLGYYFKDGTSLEHYYKEHPLTPSIEFGLRLHLKE